MTGPVIVCLWTSDGLVGEELSWSVGYGPRTHAYLRRPAGVDGSA